VGCASYETSHFGRIGSSIRHYGFSKLVSAEQGVRDRVRWCKTLVKIQQPNNHALTPTVDLVHHSLKEHLLTARDSADTNLQPFFFPSEEIHLCIAQKCFDYLHAHLAGTEYWFCDDERAMVTFPLTPYATQYWPEHARLAGEQVMKLLETNSEFFGAQGMAYTSWWRAYRMASHAGLRIDLLIRFARPHTKRDQVIPLMHLAAALGIRPWMTRCVEIEAHGEGIVSAYDRRNQSRLHYAVQRGHTDAVGWLLERGATIDDKAVFTAAAERHAPILELLLEQGGNANARAINLGVLDCEQAEEEGTEGEAIDGQKNDVEVVNKAYETALWDACGSGFEDVVRVLLEHGADPNALSPIGNHLHCPPTPTIGSPILMNSLSDGLPTPAFVAACLGGNKSLVERLLPLTKDVQKHIQTGFLMDLNSSRDTVIRSLAYHPYISPIPYDSVGEKKVYFLALLAQVLAPTIEFLIHCFGTDVDLLVSWEDAPPLTLIEMASNAPDLDTIRMLLIKEQRFVLTTL
jgi:hypothetical protein